MGDCPFCTVMGVDVPYSNDSAVAFPDRFPVADGHALVVPPRHVARVERLSAAEWLQLFALVRDVARDIAALPDVSGVNVGFNSGVAAGQTVEHAHVHVIPRRTGDVADPRGGVRHVIPARADYWSRS